MSAVYKDILAKQQKQAEMEAAGKRQYEYDSDEDTEVSHFKIRDSKRERERVPNFRAEPGSTKLAPSRWRRPRRRPMS